MIFLLWFLMMILKLKNYSLSAGQYFEVKIEYIEITNEEFKTKMRGLKIT